MKNAYILQSSLFVSRHTIDLVRKTIKVRSIEGPLFDVQNNVKRCLLYLEGLKGLNISKVFTGFVFAFIFIR